MSAEIGITLKHNHQDCHINSPRKNFAVNQHETKKETSVILTSTDHVSCFCIIIEQSAKFNSLMYMAFVDFERAFDIVAIWKAHWKNLEYQSK